MANNDQNGVPGFFAALGYPLRGARFVYIEHRSLAKFWLPPIALTAAAFVAVIWLALGLHEQWTERLWPTPLGEGWLATLAQLLHRVVSWLMALALMGAGAIVVALSTSVIAAPFNDALSEAVEALRSGRQPARWSLKKTARDVFRTLGLELSKWSLYAAVMGPLLLINWLIPGFGSVLYMLAGIGITALFFAVDYLDFPAARRDLPVRERVRFARTHWPATLGLGLGIWAFLFIPVVNLLFMPAAVAGATLLFLDLYRDPETP